MRSNLIFSEAVRRRLCAVFTVCLFVSAFQLDAKQKRGMNNETVLPQIDVILVKEASDEALRTASAARRDVEALNAKVTELEKRLASLSEEISSLSAAKIEEVETRLALLTEAYKELFAHIRVLENELLVTKKPPTPPPPPPPPQSTATFSPATEDLLSSSPEYDLYQSGLRLFNGGKYGDAAKVFADCIAKFPEGRFIDNSWYWIGECNYRLDKMKEAIEAYRKVFATPNSTKADAAQFKIGLSHHKLGSNPQARAEFRKLVDRYPASEFVERAKKYIAELK